MTLRQALIEVLMKHLPPSTSTLRLVDVSGQVGAILMLLRDDLDFQPVGDEWTFPSNSLDTVVGYDYALDGALLMHTLVSLRPGGRLIIVNPDEAVDARYVTMLENAGYTRILVEPALNGRGVLIRGEKPHPTANTLVRIQQVAQGDDDRLSLQDFSGRYVHLLVQQTPNKPVWKLTPNDVIEWHAVALDTDPPCLLAFSSLPKAVGFMQPAVMQGLIWDVNKVGKFSRDAALAWELPILLNPTLDVLSGQTVVYVAIDPNTAEAPDE